MFLRILKLLKDYFSSETTVRPFFRQKTLLCRFFSTFRLKLPRQFPFTVVSCAKKFKQLYCSTSNVKRKPLPCLLEANYSTLKCLISPSHVRSRLEITLPSLISCLPFLFPFQKNANTNTNPSITLRGRCNFDLI